MSTTVPIAIKLLVSGLGRIVALLVSKRKIPVNYGSSFFYIAVVITVMGRFVPDCYHSTAAYCPQGVKIVQVGIILTAVFEVLAGLLIMRFGKAALDRVLPPIVGIFVNLTFLIFKASVLCGDYQTHSLTLYNGA